MSDDRFEHCVNCDGTGAVQWVDEIGSGYDDNCPACEGTGIIDGEPPKENTEHGQLRAEVERLRGLLREATPTPWSWAHIGEKVNGYVVGYAESLDGVPFAGFVSDSDDVVEEFLNAHEVGEHEASTCNYADPDLIVTAINSLPALLAEVERLRGEVENLCKRQRDEFEAWIAMGRAEESEACAQALEERAHVCEERLAKVQSMQTYLGLVARIAALREGARLIRARGEGGE